MSRSIAQIGILVGLVACAPKSERWVKAKKEDTPEAYRRFVRAEPESKFASTALERMQDLDWEHALDKDSSKAWGVFLSYHPDSERAAEAQQRLLDARWKEAVEANSKARYQVFLSNHPDSPHAPDAKAKLDDIAYAEAKEANSAESYGNYLQRFFDGAHTREARQFYEDRRWQLTLQADTHEAYLDFASRFPEGRYSSHCLEILAGYRFDGLGIRLVIRDVQSPDSLAALRRAVKIPLEKALKTEKIPFTWLEPLDLRARPDRSALEGLDAEDVLPEGYGALLVELTESVGRSFAPRGNATDIRAEVHLVPLKLTPMKTVVVEASTRHTVRAQTLYGLYADATVDLGEKIATVPAGWGSG